MMIEIAREFCIDAHESIGQTRKYTNEPYWYHCMRVAALVSRSTNDQEIIAAAWLHDIIEDVAPHNEDYSYRKIINKFGDRVYKMVSDLTDISVTNDGNRSARKKIDIDHLSSASNDAKLIKLCDLADNAHDIYLFDDNFSKTFFREIKLSLTHLDGINDKLFNYLTAIILLQESKLKGANND